MTISTEPALAPPAPSWTRKAGFKTGTAYSSSELLAHFEADAALGLSWIAAALSPAERLKHERRHAQLVRRILNNRFGAKHSH